MTFDTANALFLAGPTAVGKSAVALEVAEALDGEIVSVDSMQIYRGLDIGTAKPSPAETARVPHHLISLLDLNAAFDAAQFVRLAGAAAAGIQGRGRLPVFCGGTGLYFKALLAGLGEAPPPSSALRTELEATPLPVLLAELSRLDPAAFEWIDRKNPRRVVRAVEVIRSTGRPYSAQRAAWPRPPGNVCPGPVSLLLLQRSAEDLRQRIDARVDGMFAQGLVDETRRLLDRGLAGNRTAMQAIGYRQVVEHLRGERELVTTIALVRQKTWQFARRQATWFRHQLPGEALHLEPDASPRTVARLIRERLRWRLDRAGS